MDIFNSFYAQLDWHDRNRLDEILAEYPKLYPILLQTVTDKQRVVTTRDARAVHDIVQGIIQFERSTLNDLVQDHAL